MLLNAATKFHSWEAAYKKWSEAQTDRKFSEWQSLILLSQSESTYSFWNFSISFCSSTNFVVTLLKLMFNCPYFGTNCWSRAASNSWKMRRFEKKVLSIFSFLDATISGCVRLSVLTCDDCRNRRVSGRVSLQVWRFLSGNACLKMIV